MANSFNAGALILFGVTFIVGSLRLIRGPTTADRIVVFDAVSAVIMCAVGVIGTIYDTDAYSGSIVLIVIISFVGSISTSRLIGGSQVFNGTHKKRH